jgi:hypothetical protein
MESEEMSSIVRLSGVDGTLDEEELIIVALLSLAVISVMFGHNDYAILLLAGIFAVNIIRGK